jgi:DNA processing protein
VTVVSGAAYGIDVAAHRGALAARGPTLAVLACGVDRAYPAAHTTLLDYLAERGLVVSELPPGCSPTRLRFLRNCGRRPRPGTVVGRQPSAAAR